MSLSAGANKQEMLEVRNAIIDLYLDVKVRSNEEVNFYLI